MKVALVQDNSMCLIIWLFAANKSKKKYGYVYLVDLAPYVAKLIKIVSSINKIQKNVPYTYLDTSWYNSESSLKDNKKSMHFCKVFREGPRLHSMWALNIKKKTYSARFDCFRN